jgi:hypothetical protein
MSRISVNQTKLREILRAQRFAQRATPDNLLRALEIVVEHLLDPETLTPEEIPAVADIYPDWEPDQAYAANRVLNYNGVLVRVIQAHTSQADWLPDATPALYTAFHSPGTVPDWVQPQGGHDAYAAGAEVRHNGIHWVNTHGDGNVWEPGVYGWVEVAPA